MLTYGYIREAVQAHIDLDEQEIQAMNLHNRYYIFANEAMQAICAVKPKYDYFKVKVVKSFVPLVKLDHDNYRQATDVEINWKLYGIDEPDFVPYIETEKWYKSQNIVLTYTGVRMPEDFIAFVDKQAWAFAISSRFESEKFIGGHDSPTSKEPTKIPATKAMFAYSGINTVTFYKEGEYWIPYKGIWFQFKSGADDNELIDMPIDVLLTIPLYVAAQCLQVDHIQKANAKRTEFELALSRVSSSDFLEVKRITPTFK